MPVNFLQKQESPQGPMSCGRARELDGVRRSAKYQAISMSIKNSEKQRSAPLFLGDPIGRKRGFLRQSGCRSL
jgi:hypothetical protein